MKIEGYGVGDISDGLRAWTEQVADILNALIVTDDIADDAVTYAKIQNAAALSILGRAGNSIGDLADIVAASNDLLLRRTGDTINFGALTLGMVANSLLTYAKIQDSAGVSVLGRSANSTGVLADITAGANDRLFARTADALAFVQLTIGMVPDSLLTYAKIQNSGAVSLLGRSANSAGALAEIAAAADDTFLRRTGSALNFGALTIGMIANALITYAKLQDAAACSLLGRSANSSGVLADITASTNDRLLARVSNALAFVQLTAGMVPSALITNAMLADMPSGTIKGRSISSTGVPQNLSGDLVFEIIMNDAPTDFMFAVQDVINAAPSKATLADSDKIAGTDSASSDDITTFSGAVIKSTIHQLAMRAVSLRV